MARHDRPRTFTDANDPKSTGTGAPLDPLSTAPLSLPPSSVDSGLHTPVSGSRGALAEKVKASVRAKVEHPFLRLKRLFGYAKVRYRGLAKNADRLALLFGLGNLLTAEGQLAA